MAGMRFSLRALFALTTAVAIVVWLLSIHPVALLLLLFLVSLGLVVAIYVILACAAILHMSKWLIQRLNRP